MRAAIAAHDGCAYQMIGAAFQAAFQTAPEALEASIATQRALAAEPWGEIGSVRVIVCAPDVPLDEGLDFERRNFWLLFATEDKEEGVRAFIEKRAPQWRGC